MNDNNTDKMIDDIVAMLDGSVSKGDGHVNVKVDEAATYNKQISQGCADNSINPMACSVPTAILPDDEDVMNKVNN